MLRLLHTADVHLGARHADLGEAAIAQRERQFAAFVRTIDVALAELVDVVLIAGDLFDSNVQPRRSVERVAAELRRLVERRIRTVITPGTHDVYDRASVYRAYDLPSMAAPRDAGMVVVLTPEQPSTFIATCDVSIVGRPFPTKRAPFGPLRDAGMADGLPGRWKVGLFHAAVAIPGRTDGDDVVITTQEIAASGLDYVALGHWHAAQHGARRRRHVGVQRRPGAGRRRPGPRRQRAARDARRGGWAAHGRHRGAAGRSDAVRAHRPRCVGDRESAGGDRAAR